MGKSRSAMKLIHDFEVKILDHGIGQKLPASRSHLLARGVFIASVQFHFEILAHMHGLDSLVSHMFEGVLNGFPLRIEYCFLWCDDNSCFHRYDAGLDVARNRPER